MSLRWLKASSITIGMILAASILARSPARSTARSTNKIALSYGLLIDGSGSLRLLLPYILDTSKLIISNNESNDETFIVRFMSSDKIDRLQDFTQRKELLNKAIDNIYTEGGQTAILDALYKSAQYLADKGRSDEIPRGRTLILITDGEERESHHSLKSFLELTAEKKIKVYIIGVVAELEKDKGRKASAKAVSFLTNLAAETGGKAFFPLNVSELKKNADEILKVMRSDF